MAWCMKYSGDGHWGFSAEVDGDDLVVRNVRATWFGGDDDPNDDGQTASGVNTKDNALCMGVALPMNGYNSHICQGSPLIKFPWNTRVKVYNHGTGAVAYLPLIDIGPSKRTDGAEQGAIDLTQAAMKSLCGGHLQGEIRVDYRIVGGAPIQRDLLLKG